MRNTLAALTVAAVMLLAGCIVYVPYNDHPSSPPEDEAYERAADEYSYDMDYGDFYDYLAPHGVWVYSRPHGYVWVPRHVSRGWRPYSDGRWLWTDYGWTWIAREEWGWVPFHYGRWGWDRSLGWFWVPGTVWAPAWVTWRWGDIYIGWAPLPPEVEFVPGIGLRGPYDFPDRHWIFIEGRYFQHDDLYRYALPWERNPSALRFSVRKSELALRSRQIFNDGVDIDEVTRLTRTAVARHELEDAKSPGENGVSGRSVRLYRPALKKNESARPRTYLEREEAEKEIPRIRERDIENDRSSAPARERLTEDQDREMRVLERSQEVEKDALKRRQEIEEKEAATPADKQKVAKEGEVKASELKKAHDEEKAKVGERHDQEKKTVKGGTIRKKEGA